MRECESIQCVILSHHPLATSHFFSSNCHHHLCWPPFQVYSSGVQKQISGCHVGSYSRQGVDGSCWWCDHGAQQNCWEQGVLGAAKADHTTDQRLLLPWWSMNCTAELVSAWGKRAGLLYPMSVTHWLWAALGGLGGCNIPGQTAPGCQSNSLKQAVVNN